MKTDARPTKEKTPRVRGLLAAALLVVSWSMVARAAGAADPGADLFTSNSVVRLRLELRPEDWASLQHASRTYVHATLQADGRVYREVGVHLKGSTGSFRALTNKPALTLKFDEFVHGQRFHGLRKIHLNNSVEDPSFVQEQLGGELFRAAGVPAPRVAHALVELNGRPLGVYVLAEGFTKDFLRLHFARADGRLFDSDVAPAGEATGLRTLTEAAAEPDLDRRWQRLSAALDLDRFLTFMAVEVMIGHRDGYCLARNNFRIYEDPGTQKLVFLPHGMDQLFGPADLSWRPHLSGPIARAVLECPAGRREYEARVRATFTNLFVAEKLSARADEIVSALRPFMTGNDFKEAQLAAAGVRERLVRREAELRKQLAQPEPKPLDFSQGQAALDGWAISESPDGGTMAEVNEPDGRRVLRIAAGPRTAAAWHCSVRLRSGRYRFEGRARLAGVEPLEFGRNHGAGLRVGGRDQPPHQFVGDSPWRPLTVEFTVGPGEEDVELRCELRARAGEARFDRESLQLVQLP